MSTTYRGMRGYAGGGLGFQAADGSGLEHVWHGGSDEFAEVFAKWKGGYRYYDKATGTFYRSRAERTRPEARDYLDPDYLTGPVEALPAVVRSEVADWRLPPRELRPSGRKDWLAPEPEPVPVRLDTTRPNASTPALRLSQLAREALHEFAAESRNGLETGGFFYGDREGAEGPRVRISQLERMVEDSTSHALRLDMGANVGHQWRLRSEGTDHFCELGTWHTHPNSYNGEPSEADLQMFVSGLDHAGNRKGVSRYFGVIVTPGRNSGWLVPDIHGWMVTRRSPEAAAVCQRVKVT